MAPLPALATPICEDIFEVSELQVHCEMDCIAE